MPVSHSGCVPTIRMQEHAAHMLAKTLDIPIEKHFCDVGVSSNRLSQPNFIKMLECLESYRQASGKSCFVIIYDQSCVATSNDEYGAITKAIVDAGGEIVLSGLIYEGEREKPLTVQ